MKGMRTTMKESLVILKKNKDIMDNNTPLSYKQTNENHSPVRMGQLPSSFHLSTISLTVLWLN